MVKTIVFALLIVGSIFVARIPLITWAVEAYAKRHKQDLKFKVDVLNLSQLRITDLSLNSKNVIPVVDIQYDLWASDVLKKVNITIDTLDVESLQKSAEKFLNKDTQNQEPVTFESAQAICIQLQKIELKFHLREVVVGTQKIPLELSALNKSSETSIEWDDKKNSQGALSLQCKHDELLAVLSRFHFELRQTNFTDTWINTLLLDLKSADITWRATQPLSLKARGTLDLDYTQNKQRYLWSLPLIHLQGLYQNNGTIDGEFQIPNLSFGLKKKSDQLAGLDLSGTLTKTKDTLKSRLRFRDKTKELFIDDLLVTQEQDTLRIQADVAKTKLKWSKDFPLLVPDSQKWTKSILGVLKVGVDVVYKQEKWSGSLHLVGENISSQSDFGDYEGISFDHKIQSLDDFSTPQKQSLKIRKINLGPGVQDLKVVYKMPSMNTIEVQSFSAVVGKGEMYAENFVIYPQKKRIEKFLAQIINVDLETLLAIGLKDTVKAKGVLHGHLGITYQGSRPVFKGLLTDPQPGWIQYRTGNTQAAGIALSDGPMEILNNYLYDFQYQNLSLTLSSDTNYDMDMTLAALGHNPNYLGGKPLKLNVNLQQNLLAAMQSLMLTYDLPNRIREKFEQVDP